jgi:hypothetical protein
MSLSRSLFAVLTFNTVVCGAAVARGVTKAGKPGLYFGEGRFTMLFSCAQLLAVAVFAFRIFHARRLSSIHRPWFAPHNLWMLIAAGFVFLACDEAFQIHEQVDQAVHGGFSITQSDLTDRLDDFLIGGYLLVGLSTLWTFRSELRHFRAMLLPLLIGFVFAGLSVACDIAGHHQDLFRALGADKAQAGGLAQWADVGDGAFTLFAEGCFVVAFYLGYHHTSATPAAEVRD